ncbi:MAG: hypothetical protein H7X80_04210, partial [bacterium]|nr:hypothetical protein [Candidatus Kapabacteria bacterium]
LQPRILPIFMPSQGIATITVDAFSSDTSKVFRDTLFLRSNCGTVLIPLAFSTTDRQPGPQITGYDFGSQWLTEGPCSKNPANEYTGRVDAYNTGNTEMTVNAIRILGADAGFFSLGTAERINQGDRIAAAFPGDTARRYQTIVFKPGPQERAYSAVVELATSDGKTVRSFIRGTGIESHLNINVDTLKSTAGIGHPPEYMDFYAIVGDSRPTTITNVAIAPAGPYTLLTPRGDIVKTHAAGDTVRMRVGFQPTAEGSFPAKVTLSGNFSACDDSVVVLAGTGVVRVSAPDESATFSVSEPMPNPTTGVTSITVSLARRADVLVELIDARGNVAQTISHSDLPAGSNRLELNTSAVLSGTYALRTRVGNDRHVVIRSIVVVH